MEPTLTWLDLTVTDRNKMRRMLDLFKEQGTIDEMGLGSLRDTLSDELFPGTSSIQTRLRYMLFIPWIYKGVEARRIAGDQVALAARMAEIDLIRPLEGSHDTGGIIGARSHGSLIRLPSSVYWAGLVRWNVFQHMQSQSWFHTHFATLTHGRDGVGRADDPGVIWTHQPNWHPRLPEPPTSFPWESSFALTCDEAEFLRSRIEERCVGTLLAWLAREGSEVLADNFWEDPDTRQASEAVDQTVELARRFSLHVEGMPLIYNLLLAEHRHSKYRGDEDLIDQYRVKLAEWANREAEESPYNPNVLWTLLARRGKRLPEPQRRFVETWSRRIVETPAMAEDDLLRTLIADRELQLKNGRARLVNPARLLEWNGRAGVGRMDFRWSRVRQLLIDLRKGLAA